jgi:hypothetical protein
MLVDLEILSVGRAYTKDVVDRCVHLVRKDARDASPIGNPLRGSRHRFNLLKPSLQFPQCGRDGGDGNVGTRRWRLNTSSWL